MVSLRTRRSNGPINVPPREEERLKIRLKFPDRDKFARLYERELAKGGIFLKSPQLKPIGTAVEIHLLPKGTELGLRLIGQIIHVVSVDDAELMGSPPGMGVRFTDLDDDKRALIDAYVSGLADDFVAPAPDPVPTPLPAGDERERSATGDPLLDALMQETAESLSPEEASSPPPVHDLSDPEDLAEANEATDSAPAEEEPPADEEIDEAANAKFAAELDEIEAPLTSGEDVYKLLDVDPNSSPTEIKEAFTELKKRCHPDRFAAKGTEEILERANRVYSEINKAFVTLSSPGRRAAYNIMTGRFGARYQTAEEEEAHRQAAREFRRKYVEKFGAKVRKAEMFARSARSQALAGRVNSAKNNLKLGLSFDPLNEEYRDLLIRLESGEFEDGG